MTLHQTETQSAAGPSTAAAATPQRPPSARRFSIRPAMTVLVSGVVILAVFVTIGILSTHQPVTVRTNAASTLVPGSALRAQAAAGPLSVITKSGEPPANILNAVVVPTGSVRVAHQDNGGGGQYDRQVTFRSDASQAALLAFFAGSMRQNGWQIFDRGPAARAPGTAAGSSEVLGKLAGADGYYWEMGAVVAPTTFGRGAPATGTTDFTVRLFQVNDSQ
jgi:hypothetical protein